MRLDLLTRRVILAGDSLRHGFRRPTMTTAAASTNLTPATPLKLSQRVRTQLTAANARIDQETARVKGALVAVAARLRALFPVPSRSDIAELSARLERLEKEIDRLAGARTGAPAAPSTANGVPESVPASTPTPTVAEKRVRKPKPKA
jgi:hypothetical protein